MKKCIALALAASALLLAGCSSMHHATNQWEYKIASTPAGPEGTLPAPIARREQFLNELAKDGWVLVSADTGLFYLKRPKR